MNRRFFATILSAVILSAGVLGGCSGGTKNNGTQNTESTAASADTSVNSSSEGTVSLPENGGFGTVSYELSKDKYRTYYEIFPYSFCDSNGDGIGDLKGIISKLDYLNDGNPETTDDLGVEGIWLMPIMPSPSYHKYNCKDYMDIDPDYGTLDDFKELVEQAHKRNINVIIDLVLNHTSRTHPWYKSALKELKEGKTDGYAEYYHFEKNKKADGWRSAGVDDWCYECEFDSDMPDLNLKNEKVREEIKKIVDFWLGIGVDGFRLDAVLWFESTGDNDSIEDLKWLYDYAKTVKEDVYMVGECWTNSAIIANYYKSGLDSFFDFDEQGPTGRVKKALTAESAKQYVKQVSIYEEDLKNNNAAAINTPFISNHDTARSAEFFSNETYRRMAASMYLMIPGNSFVYYGEEIGMKGSANDPDKRTGMYWSASDKTGYVEKIPGASNTYVPEKAVDEQLKDNDSLLTFYKKAIALKNQNPEIARGTMTVVDLGSDACGGYVADYDGSKVLVVFNASPKSEKVTVPSDKFTVKEVRGYLYADMGDVASSSGSDDLDDIFGGGGTTGSKEDDNVKEIKVSGQEVTLPAFSTIVLK